LIVTQNFGVRDNYAPQVLGVVFDDRNQNGFYDAGEGLPGVTIEVASGTRVYQVTSMEAGGYQIPVAPGRYSVTARGGGLGHTLSVDNVQVRNVNVKVDFDSRVRLPGDSNGDGTFNSQDVVTVLQSAKFRTQRRADHDEGDWNQDGVFDQRDIITLLAAEYTTETLGSAPTTSGIPYSPDATSTTASAPAIASIQGLIVFVMQSHKYLSDEFASFDEGDVNLDGRFDQRDLARLLQNIETGVAPSVVPGTQVTSLGQNASRVPGDVNGDGRFDRGDVTIVLQSDKYLQPSSANHGEGDWNGDGRFDISDIIFALQVTGWTKTASLADAGNGPGDVHQDGRFDRLDLVFALQSDR
jgi:hypothetical protein